MVNYLVLVIITPRRSENGKLDRAAAQKRLRNFEKIQPVRFNEVKLNERQLWNQRDL